MDYSILKRQRILHIYIKNFRLNFKKLGSKHKASSYIKERLKILDSYWAEYKYNHNKLLKSEGALTYLSQELYYEKAQRDYNLAKAHITNISVTPDTCDKTVRPRTMECLDTEVPGPSKPIASMSSLDMKKYDEKTQVKLEWIGLVLIQYRCFSFQHNYLNTYANLEDLKYARLVTLDLMKRKFNFPDNTRALRCLEEYVAVYTEQMWSLCVRRAQPWPRWVLLAHRALGAKVGAAPGDKRGAKRGAKQGAKQEAKQEANHNRNKTTNGIQEAIVSALFLIIEHYFKKHPNKPEREIIHLAADSVAVNRECLWSWWLVAKWKQWATTGGQEHFTRPDRIESSKLLLRVAQTCDLESRDQRELERAVAMCRAGGVAVCAPSVLCLWAALRLLAADRVLLRYSHPRLSAPHALYLAVVTLVPDILADSFLARTGYEHRDTEAIQDIVKQEGLTAQKKKITEIAAAVKQMSDDDDGPAIYVSSNSRRSDDQTLVSEHQRMTQNSDSEMNSDDNSDDGTREPLRFYIDVNSKDLNVKSERDINDSEISDNFNDKDSYLAKNTILLELLNSISESKDKNTGRIEELAILDPNRAEAIITFDDDDDDDDSFGDDINNFIGNNAAEESANANSNDSNLSQHLGEKVMINSEDSDVKYHNLTIKQETSISDIISSCIEKQFRSYKVTSVPDGVISVPDGVIDDKLLLCPQVILNRLDTMPFWKIHQKDGAIDLSVMSVWENMRNCYISDQSSLDGAVIKRRRSSSSSDDVPLDVIKRKKPRCSSFKTERSSIDGAESNKLECYAYMRGSAESMMRFCRPIDVRLSRLPNILIERHKTACKFRVVSTCISPFDRQEAAPLAPRGPRLRAFLASLESTPGAIDAMFSSSPPSAAPVPETNETLLSILMKTTDRTVTTPASAAVRSKASATGTSKPGGRASRAPPVCGDPNRPAPQSEKNRRNDFWAKYNLPNMQIKEKETRRINVSETETNRKEKEKETDPRRETRNNRKETETHSREKQTRKKYSETRRKETEINKRTNKEQGARKTDTKDRVGNKTSAPAVIRKNAVQQIDLVSDDDNNGLEIVTDLPVTDTDTSVIDIDTAVKVSNPETRVAGESGQTVKKKTKGDIIAQECAVCGLKQADAADKSVRFLKFPTEITRCRSWLIKIGNEELVDISLEELNHQYRVCSNHFRRIDFTKKGWLRLRGIPSLGLPATPLTTAQVAKFPRHVKKDTTGSKKKKKLSPAATGDVTAPGDTPLTDAYEEWQRQKTLCDQYFNIPNMVRVDKQTITNRSTNKKGNKSKTDDKDKDGNKPSVPTANSKIFNLIDLTLDNDGDSGSDSDNDSDGLEINTDYNDSVSGINYDVDENVTENNDGNIFADKYGSNNTVVARTDVVNTTVADNIIEKPDAIKNQTINDGNVTSITDKNNVKNSVTVGTYAENLAAKSDHATIDFFPFRILTTNREARSIVTNKTESTNVAVSNETRETVTLPEFTTVVPDRVDSKNDTDENTIKIEQSVFSSNDYDDSIVNIEPKLEIDIDDDNLSNAIESTKSSRAMLFMNPYIDRFPETRNENVNNPVNFNNSASPPMFVSPHLNKDHEGLVTVKDVQEVNKNISSVPWIKSENNEYYTDNTNANLLNMSVNHLNMGMNQPNMNVNHSNINVNPDDRNVNHIHINLNQNPTINQWNSMDQLTDMNQKNQNVLFVNNSPNQHNMNMKQYTMNMNQHYMNVNQPIMNMNQHTMNVNSPNMIMNQHVMNVNQPNMNMNHPNIIVTHPNINQPNQNLIVNDQTKPLFVPNTFQPVYQLNQPNQTFTIPISLSVNHSPILQIAPLGCDIQPICSQNPMEPKPPITQSPYIQLGQIQQMDSSQHPVVSLNITAQTLNENQQVTIQPNSDNLGDVILKSDESGEDPMPIITQVTSLAYAGRQKRHIPISESDESAEIEMPIISQVTSLADKEGDSEKTSTKNTTLDDESLMKLFGKVREFAKEYKYRYCTLVDRKICVQKVGARAKWIENDQDLELLRYDDMMRAKFQRRRKQAPETGAEPRSEPADGTDQSTIAIKYPVDKSLVELLDRVREFAKEYNYHDCVLRHGKIYLRDKCSADQCIETASDLERLRNDHMIKGKPAPETGAQPAPEPAEDGTEQSTIKNKTLIDKSSNKMDDESMKKLFEKAQEFAKEYNYPYCGLRTRKIYVRNSGNNTKWIESESDLEWLRNYHKMRAEARKQPKPAPETGAEPAPEPAEDGTQSPIKKTRIKKSLVKLFKKVREFAKEYNYRHCMLKDHKIYVRNHGITTWIKNERDFEKLRNDHMTRAKQAPETGEEPAPEPAEDGTEQSTIKNNTPIDTSLIKLFKTVREFAKEYDYRYCGLKDRKIYLRNPGFQAKWIQTESDLESLRNDHMTRAKQAPKTGEEPAPEPADGTEQSTIKNKTQIDKSSNEMDEERLKKLFKEVQEFAREYHYPSCRLKNRKIYLRNRAGPSTSWSTTWIETESDLERLRKDHMMKGKPAPETGEEPAPEPAEDGTEQSTIKNNTPIDTSSNKMDDESLKKLFKKVQEFAKKYEYPYCGLKNRMIYLRDRPGHPGCRDTTWIETEGEFESLLHEHMIRGKPTPETEFTISDSLLKLFKKVQEFAKESNYRDCGLRDRKIYLRSQGCQTIWIETESDLEKLRNDYKMRPKQTPETGAAPAPEPAEDGTEQSTIEKPTLIDKDLVKLFKKVQEFAKYRYRYCRFNDGKIYVQNYGASPIWIENESDLEKLRDEHMMMVKQARKTGEEPAPEPADGTEQSTIKNNTPIDTSSNEMDDVRLKKLFKEVQEFAKNYNFRDFGGLANRKIYLVDKRCKTIWIKSESDLDRLRSKLPVSRATVYSSLFIDAAGLECTDGLLLFDESRPPKAINSTSFLVTRSYVSVYTPVYWVLAPFWQSKMVKFPETRTEPRIKVKSFARSQDANALCESETATAEVSRASETATPEVSRASVTNDSKTIEIIDGNVYKRIRKNTLAAVLTDISSLVLSGQWVNSWSLYMYDSDTGQVRPARPRLVGQLMGQGGSQPLTQYDFIVNNDPITFQNLKEETYSDNEHN